MLKARNGRCCFLRGQTGRAGADNSYTLHCNIAVGGKYKSAADFLIPRCLSLSLRAVCYCCGLSLAPSPEPVLQLHWSAHRNFSVAAYKAALLTLQVSRAGGAARSAPGIGGLCPNIMKDSPPLMRRSCSAHAALMRRSCGLVVVGGHKGHLGHGGVVGLAAHHQLEGGARLGVGLVHVPAGYFAPGRGGAKDLRAQGRG